MYNVCYVLWSIFKTQLAVLINSEMGAATCCAQKHSNYWCQNTTDLPSPDEQCNASMCLHVGRPKDHLASVPRSHFELHTAQFASPISHASLHMCTRARTRTVYAHRKLNGGNYTEFILPGCAFKCKLFAANFSFWTLQKSMQRFSRSSCTLQNGKYCKLLTKYYTGNCTHHSVWPHSKIYHFTTLHCTHKVSEQNMKLNMHSWKAHCMVYCTQYTCSDHTVHSSEGVGLGGCSWYQGSHNFLPGSHCQGGSQLSCWKLKLFWPWIWREILASLI